MGGRLQDKVAIVTGAASGLGRATAAMFAREGAAVLCADVSEAVEETAAEVADVGGQAHPFTGDLTDPATAEAMTGLALETFGQVDVVFACAGIAGAGMAGDTPMQQWERVIGVNLTSKWLSFKYALPHMVARGRGSIIVQASIGGVIGVPNIFPYAAAKGGCIAMVRQAAVDYGPSGIRVNGIAPGTIPTPLVIESYRGGGGMTAASGVEEGLRRAPERYPLRRLGEPDEVAHLATYLASDESAWTTGQTFVIDGGISVA